MTGSKQWHGTGEVFDTTRLTCRDKQLTQFTLHMVARQDPADTDYTARFAWRATVHTVYMARWHGPTDRHS